MKSDVRTVNEPGYVVLPSCTYIYIIYITHSLLNFGKVQGLYSAV